MTPETINQCIQALEDRMDAVYALSEKVATLSTGVLAFTVTFAKLIAPPTTHHLPLTIKISWGCFLAAITRFFLIHSGKVEIHKRTMNALRERETRFVLVKPPFYFHVGRWMLSCFLGGIFLLAVYGFQSI